MKTKSVGQVSLKNANFGNNISTFEDKCSVLGKNIMLGKIHFVCKSKFMGDKKNIGTCFLCEFRVSKA